MKHIYLFLAILICISVEAQIIPVKHLAFEDSKLHDGGITSLYEDRDGFIWLGAYGKGLARYDGKNVECIYENPAINKGYTFGTKIEDIYQDKYGYLWLICNEEDKYHSNIVAVSNRPVGKDLIADSLHFVTQHLGADLLKQGLRGTRFSINDAGKILVHTTHLLVEYYYSSPTTLVADTILDASEITDQEPILTALYLSDGRIAYITVANNYVVIDAPEGKLMNADTVQVNNEVNYVLLQIDDHGGAWAGSSEHCLYIPPIENFETSKLKYIPVVGPIASMVYLDDEILLVSSKGSGLSEINPKTFEIINNYTSNHGFKNNGLFNIHKGKHDIWIGSANGCQRLPHDYRAFNAYTPDFKINDQPFLPSEGVNATLSKIKLKNDSREFNAACTSSGVVLFNKEGDYQLIDESDGLNSAVTINVLIDSKNRLWISSVKRGLNCIYPKGESPAQLVDKRPLKLFGLDYEIGIFPNLLLYTPNLISIPSEDKSKKTEEAICGAYANGIMIARENGKVVLIPRDDLFDFIDTKSGFDSRGRVNLVKQDHVGHLYVGNSLGLWRTIKPMTIEYYEQLKNNGVEKSGSFITNEKVVEQVPLSWHDSVFNFVNNLIIHDEEIWVGVPKGILILSVHDLQPVDFIESNTASPPGSFAYRDNQIWVGTIEGLSAFDVETRELVRRVTVDDGLLNGTNWGPQVLSVTSTGLLYFGTTGGLMEYNPTLHQPHNADIPIVIRDFAYTENNWGKNQLNLSFIGLTYDDPKKMKYKTRLSGQDDDWSKPGTETEIRYTNLSAFLFPKTYAFDVMASDYRGEWHQMKSSFPIKVNPSFWGRWWSFLLYGLLIFVVVRKYTQWKLKEQQKTLELKDAKIIKEQKLALEKKNAENELLLKEIHHRVKNNLQTISSLLSLQSQFIKDDLALDAVKESQHRVESMALIHQKLYQGENLAAIEMKDYFQTIAKSAKDSFGLISENINLEVNMDSMELDVDMAVPIGLISNELITNSLKHGFKDRGQGMINISLTKTSDDLLQLVIADNGVGMDNEKSEQHKGFGSLLIRLLVTQIDGSMRTETKDGTKFILEFAEQEKVA